MTDDSDIGTHMGVKTQRTVRGNDPDKAIISVSMTGAMTLRSRCPTVPYTPQEIAEQAQEAREAGAAAAHIHARTENGSPTYDTQIYQEIYDEVRDHTDILINFSTGALHEPLESRIEYVKEVGPDIAALNMGSMNYARWSDNQEDYAYNMVFENPLNEIEDMVKAMNEAGVKPELECFDTGHIGSIRPLLKQGILEHPINFSVIMGIVGGIPPTVNNLMNQVRQLPDDANWQVIGIGYPTQWPLIGAALSMGGNVRVGVEDNYYLDEDTKASNAELVERAARMARDVDREPATPDEAAEIMEFEPNSR
ncbi:MAG: 3-keto-5-aminohexanoate cleavage protein [Halobacteriales archaeon]|nr:3-keto-5-aminohexanoate cleavage protein [Halobacteriales archaeon]